MTENKITTVLETDRVTVLIKIADSAAPASFSFPVRRSTKHPHAVKIDGHKLCDYMRSLVHTIIEVCDGRT